MPKIQYLLFILLTVSVWGNIAVHSSQLNKLVLKSSSKEFENPGICVQEAKCEPVHNATCFGTVLPYAFTSLALAEDSVSPLEIQDNLALWQGLRTIPRCWVVVQSLLCAIYMPKCENGTLSLPSQEMCKITRGPCRAVETKHGWPPFLRCENRKIFPPGCRNPLQEVKFNTSSKCVPPLVETDNPDSWYDGVEGCGLQCQSPFFTAREHERAHGFIKVMASMCFAANLFTVLTFLISWKVANRYPAVIIFYINVCLSVASFGWLIQFFPGAKEEIVCLPDGTVRRKQPRSGEHLCSITFILIYSFIMAALVWFVILTYAWHVLFRQSGVPKDIVRKKVAYFHLSAWCIPLVLTTVVMAMKEVDGDSVSGICFVGYANHVMRVGFLIVPVIVAAFIGGFFLISGLYTLVKVKLSTQEVANGQVKKRIRHMILKIGIFSIISLIFVLCTFACHAYDIMYKGEWEQQLREYIVCLATLSASSSSSLPHTPCDLKVRPSITVVQLHLMSYFGFGIVMASWVWTRGTLDSWRRFFYRLCEPPEKNALAIKRHQLIAKAFQHRNEINQGHLSFSLNSTHEDPVGMNFDVNSVASRELSSTWVSALPQFISRRNAVASVSPLGLKHYSSASDVSTRRISLESFHQQNLDSLSLQISEQEYAHVLRHQRRKTRKERERFLRANRIAPWFPGSRRGSDTSIQSSIIAASVAAVAAARAAGGKVTKATSTGDLTIGPTFSRPPTSYVVNRQLTQRQAILNLPFTHGMTDNSHCFNVSTRQKPPETGYLSAQPVQNAGSSRDTGASQSPFAALYNQNYGYVPPVPLGYLPGNMYPGFNPLLPRYLPVSGNIDCVPYGPPPYLQYGHYQVPQSLTDQCQQHLIPLHPTADSASETEYLPIFLSDSEYTDGGHRSFDEAQLLSAQKLLQEHSLQKSVNCIDRSQSRPMLQPQIDPRIQFSRSVTSPTSAVSNGAMTQEFGIPSCAKMPPHSEPPPSPADSETYEDFPDCNLLSKGSLPKASSKQSVHSAASALLSQSESASSKPNVEKSIIHMVKSSIRRAASFSHGFADAENLELNLRTSRLSLRCAANGKDRGHETSETLLENESSPGCGNLESNKPPTNADVCENVSR